MADVAAAVLRARLAGALRVDLVAVAFMLSPDNELPDLFDPFLKSFLPCFSAASGSYQVLHGTSFMHLAKRPTSALQL